MESLAYIFLRGFPRAPVEVGNSFSCVAKSPIDVVEGGSQRSDMRRPRLPRTTSAFPPPSPRRAGAESALWSDRSVV
eukprot:4855059-Pyramimonas_sp.AAC.1